MITHHNTRIHVAETGHGAPIVLLHGWPTNSRLWQPLLGVLGAQARAITFDWPGFGQSDPPAAYTFSYMQSVLDSVMAAVLHGQEQVTLVAHDIGGPPAILWASEHPGRVARLVLLNTVLYPFSTPLDQISHSLFRVPGLQQLLMHPGNLRLTMNLLSAQRDRAARAHIRDIIGGHARVPARMRAETILGPLHAGKRAELPTLEARLEALTAPLHLIIGRSDPLCYRHMRTFADRHPDVPATTLPHCGHFLAVDQPQALAATLLEALGHADQQGAGA
ncbi:MAG: alpha/beta fold hydrolase [Bacteroidia bacterium]